MDILQEESIPLGIGLGVVLYLYMDAFSEEKKKAGGIEIRMRGRFLLFYRSLNW